MSYLTFNNVKKNYEIGNDVVQALQSINFGINEAEFTIVLGPSGSGKSTLLNLLGGMDTATSGKIFVDGIDVTSLNQHQLTDYRRHDVGFVFQFYNLIPSLSVYENVDMAARLGRQSLDAKEILSSVGLENRMKHFPAELSGGELQRTSIARAICKNPKILLCDEPTGALDSETGRMILSLLHKMSRDYRQTVIVVTHNSLIAPAADKVISIKDGKISDVQINEQPISMGKVVW